MSKPLRAAFRSRKTTVAMLALGLGVGITLSLLVLRRGPQYATVTIKLCSPAEGQSEHLRENALKFFSQFSQIQAVALADDTIELKIYGSGEEGNRTLSEILDTVRFHQSMELRICYEEQEAAALTSARESPALQWCLLDEEVVVRGRLWTRETARDTELAVSVCAYSMDEINCNRWRVHIVDIGRSRFRGVRLDLGQKDSERLVTFLEGRTDPCLALLFGDVVRAAPLPVIRVEDDYALLGPFLQNEALQVALLMDAVSIPLKVEDFHFSLKGK